MKPQPGTKILVNSQDAVWNGKVAIVADDAEFTDSYLAMRDLLWGRGCVTAELESEAGKGKYGVVLEGEYQLA